MLKFWNSESYVTQAEGAPTSYLVYQDDTTPHLFYLIPNQPRIATNAEGKLSFVFRKYRFRSDQEREDRKRLGLGGAYVIFDVVLRVPDVAKLDILKQIKDRYTTRLAKRDDAATKAAGKDATDAQKATAAAAQKNTDGILSVEDIQIAPLPFMDGSVGLNISPNANAAFVQSITALGKPSQDGNNTASFSAELTIDGATFFENAMNSSEGGAIQVFYKLKTWFRTADTVVTASYSKANALKYKQVIEDHVGATIWNEGSYSNTITETLTKNEIIKVDTVWGSTDYTPDQQAQIRKWAQDAVADAVKRQLADITAPADAGSAARGRGGTTTRTYDLTLTTGFSQTYRESFAMLMELNPQGMLPNVSSMKDKDGKPFEWKNYFREIDLDDPFFKTLRLGVSTDVDVSDSSPVSRVDVELWFKDTQNAKDYHTTLSFTKGDPGRKQWDPYGADQNYSYQYTITFKDGPAFVSPKLEGTTKELVVGARSEGLAVVDVISSGLSPTTIQQCEVTVQVVDPAKKTKGPSTTVVLTGAKVQQSVVLPVGNQFTAPYFYEYTRVYTVQPDGKRVTSATAVGSARQLMISDPFSDYRTVNLRAPALTEGDTAFVQLEYGEGDSYSRSLSKTLDSDNKAGRWIFGIFNRAAGRLTYSGAFDLKDGSSVEIPSTTATGDLINLKPSSGNATQFTVTLDASLIDWATSGLQILEVMLKYGDKKATLVFKAGKLPDAAPTKTFDIVGGQTSYEWSATYYVKKDGKTTQLKSKPTTVDSEYLVLPGPDEAATA